MFQPQQVSRPIPPVVQCIQSTAGTDATVLQVVPELVLRMESHQAELIMQLQRLESLILQMYSPGHAPANSDKLNRSVVGCDLADESCETTNSNGFTKNAKGLQPPAVTELCISGNLSAAAGLTTNCVEGNPAPDEAAKLQSYALENNGPEELNPVTELPSNVPGRTSQHPRSKSQLSFGATKYEDNFCALLVSSPRFDHACAVLIVASSLIVGIEVQYKTEENADLLDALGYSFVCLFSLELLVRMRARGIKRYFTGLDFAWSFFDLFCVSSSYLELIVSSVQQDSSGSFLLVVRTLRVVRIARIIRVIRFLGKLRTMVYTMLGAMKMLGWAALLLGMVMYMFSVCFTEAARPVILGEQEIIHGETELVLALGKDHFGDLYTSMLTLFESITGGVSWHEPLRVLKEVSALYVIMFLCYVCVAVLTILNVITGLCCDYAIQNAVADRADVIKQQITLKDRWRSQFATIFKAIDEDGSGEVTSEELRHQLQQEEFQAYLSHLNISVDDAFELLEVLDSDGDGSVSFDEFVTGCMRVKGQAKTIDLMKIQRECICIDRTLQQLVDEMRSQKLG